ncbi:hypothetical protein PF005_g19841 [Phytophthora fragariae]|uniref:Retrotransposon gag domain-containing protein n=1 Tax=Phytophthora fragariae TaxID=53985 RepID=A0A6A3RZ11_9STRA|nr:hypothetical protein PF003_g36397 [Phytophthora fragariae]KAE8927779.1 hypothetical protein PF009_g22062 [Phytophthora fragariae]KAE8985003.1 hypothetical protein PF011_g20559 [Phytophthora fragariae]KAE9085741.1 hypothetical protein PF010_g20345 [Phytophthora fragariae]KAE9105692.1 hypothetical protein PF006_g21562 [Phytophthora fragariae]
MATLPSLSDLQTRLQELLTQCQEKIGEVEGIERAVADTRSGPRSDTIEAELEALEGQLKQAVADYDSLMARAQRIRSMVELMRPVVTSAPAPTAPAPVSGHPGYGQAPPPAQAHYIPPFQQRPRRSDTLPLFRGPAPRGIADPHDFMDKFEASCTANWVPFEFWASLLVDSVRVQEMHFVRSIAQPGQPWPELRRLFLEHYYSPHIESARLTELMSCTLRRVESVQDFGDRFVSLMEKCHLDASDEGYKQLFTLKLKPHNVYLWTAVLQF